MIACSPFVRHYLRAHFRSAEKALEFRIRLMSVVADISTGTISQPRPWIDFQQSKTIPSAARFFACQKEGFDTGCEA